MEDFYLYMKKSKLFTLPLIALALIGCSKTNTSDSTSSSSPSNISQTSNTTDSSTKENTSITSNDDVTTNDKGGSTSSDSSTSSATDASKWGSDIIELFNKHLGGYVIPYVNLGSGTFGDWEVSSSDYGVLTIESGNKTWDSETTPKAFEDAFTAANCKSIVKADTMVTATSQDGLVKITATKKGSIDNTIIITATYEEPYDKSKALDDWDNETKKMFKEALGESIPYLYTGLQYPYVDIAESGETVTIEGGKWNDSILTDLKTTLNDKKATFSDETDTGFTALLPMTSGSDSFKIVISKQGNSVAKVHLEVSVIETFNPDAAEKVWDSSVTDLFDDYLDGHQIPFVYLGTKSASGEYDSYTEKIKIKGNIWDNQILTLAEAAFKGDTSDNSTWTTNTIGSEFTATTVKEDECQITVKISKYSDYYSTYPLMEITFKEGMVQPSTVTEWEDATKTLIENNFPADFELPYVYLNLKNSATEKATWDANTSTLKITGGYYISAVAEKALAKYSTIKDTDGETLYWDINTSSYAPYLTMTHTVASTGTQYIVKITKEADSTSGKDLATLTCTLLEKYHQPENATKWNDNVSKAIKENLHGHEIPYVYFRTYDETYTWYGSYNELDIKGGAFDTDMLPVAKANFEAKGWSATIANNEMKATYEDKTDGCKLSARIAKSGDNTILEITITEKYDKNNAQSDWNEKTTQAIKSYYGDETIPYTYLGTKSETIDASDSKYLVIKGGSWNNEIIEDAKGALEKNDYTYISTKYGSTKAALFVKEDTENNYFYTIYLYQDGGKPTMKLFKESTLNCTASKQNYDDQTLKMIKQYNGGYEIPFIDFGYDTLSTSYYSSSKYLEVSSQGSVSNYQMYRSYKKFNDDSNYTVDVTIYTSSFYFTATTKNADGSTTTINMQNGYCNAYFDLVYTPAFVVPDTVSWGSELENAMKTNFEGNVIPAFYLGSDSPTYYYSSSYNKIEISGGTWNDSIFDLCITALNKDADTDGKSYWTYMYEYSESKKLIATKKIGDKYMTIRLYKYTATNPYPKLEVYYNTTL